MRMRATAVVAALFVLAGCGGSSERLSRDEYTAKADAICAKTVRQQRQLPAPASIDGIPDYVDHAVPIVDSLLAEMRRLRPPMDIEDTVNEWLDVTRQARDQLRSLGSAGRSGDAETVRVVAAKGNELDGYRGTLARSIGLTTCANT